MLQPRHQLSLLHAGDAPCVVGSETCFLTCGVYTTTPRCKIVLVLCWLAPSAGLTCLAEASFPRYVHALQEQHLQDVTGISALVGWLALAGGM